MKKLLIISSIISLLLSSGANAKTEGSYIEFGVSKANIDAQTTKTLGSNNDSYFNNESDASSVGFGLGYKYAINFDNFFVVPGVFYEYLGLEAQIDNEERLYQQDININSRLGAKVDLGYDIADKFAVYIPVGINIFTYEFMTNDYLNSSNYVKTENSGSSAGLFYGLGFNFYPIKNMSISLEYNRSSIDVESLNDVALAGTAALESTVDIDIIKLGFGYKF